MSTNSGTPRISGFPFSLYYVQQALWSLWQNRTQEDVPLPFSPFGLWDWYELYQGINLLIKFCASLQRLEELFAQELERESSYYASGASPLPSDLCELPAHIPPCSYNRGSTRSSLSSVSADWEGVAGGCDCKFTDSVDPTAPSESQKLQRRNSRFGRWSCLRFLLRPVRFDTRLDQICRKYRDRTEILEILIGEEDTENSDWWKDSGNSDGRREFSAFWLAEENVLGIIGYFRVQFCFFILIGGFSAFQLVERISGILIGGERFRYLLLVISECSFSFS